MNEELAKLREEYEQWKWLGMELNGPLNEGSDGFPYLVNGKQARNRLEKDRGVVWNKMETLLREMAAIPLVNRREQR